MDCSVIIPTFNSEKYIYKCLESILNSNTDEKYEIVIVDGGSTDLTVKIASSFQQVKVISSTNVSVSNSRNKGAAASSGDILIFIDSDCMMNKFLLRNARNYLKEYSCYGSFYKPDPSHGWISGLWLDIERKKDGIVKWLTSGTLAVTRKAFDGVGGFNESLQAEEDEDFCYRIRVDGGKIYNDSSVASIHLGQSDSISDFFRKEVWRGRSIIKPFLSVNLYKFSLFDFIIIVYFLSFICMVLSIFNNYFFYMSGLILILVPILFSLRSMIYIKNYRNFLKIFLLYYVYFFARSWSIIKYNQVKNFIKF